MTLDYPLPEYSLNLHSYALCNGNNCIATPLKPLAIDIGRLLMSQG